MLLLDEQQRADTLHAACHDAVLILTTVCEQLGVQIGKISGRRYRGLGSRPPSQELERCISLEDQSNQRQTSSHGRIDCHLALPVLSRQVSKNGQNSSGMSLACPYLSRVPRRAADLRYRSPTGVDR